MFLYFLLIYLLSASQWLASMEAPQYNVWADGMCWVWAFRMQKHQQKRIPTIITSFTIYQKRQDTRRQRIQLDIAGWATPVWVCCLWCGCVCLEPQPNWDFVFSAPMRATVKRNHLRGWVKSNKEINLSEWGAWTKNMKYIKPYCYLLRMFFLFSKCLHDPTCEDGGNLTGELIIVIKSR